MLPRLLVSLALTSVVAFTAAAYGQRTATGTRTPARAPAHPVSPAHSAAHPPAVPPVAARKNPLLPPPVDVAGFYPDIALLQKLPAIAPQGFEPLYTAEDWQTYRDRYSAEADGVSKLKSSGQLAFAEKLMKAAQTSTGTAASPGLRRLLLIRSAAIAYRMKGGYPLANEAVNAYFAVMDKTSATQVGALWTLASTLSRTAVTPKPERIRYDGIAAKANMQLALLLLEADQVESAQAIIKQIGYHEGWLKFDKDNGPAIKAQIAQVRARVAQVARMMDYLGKQYDPAVNNDANALLAVYLYGCYVKNNPSIVADLPGRVPNSALSQLAASIDRASKDPTAAYAAAENLRILGTNIPDALIRQRTLYASLQNYRAFLKAPQTERDRIHRSLARMSLGDVISDGAYGPTTIDPFAPPPAPPATAPAIPPASPPQNPRRWAWPS